MGDHVAALPVSPLRTSEILPMLDISVQSINKEVGHLKALSIGRFPRMKTF